MAKPSKLPNTDAILALVAKGSVQIANGKDSRATRTELAAELRTAGHSEVADLVDPNVPGNK